MLDDGWVVPLPAAPPRCIPRFQAWGLFAFAESPRRLFRQKAFWRPLSRSRIIDGQIRADWMY